MERVKKEATILTRFLSVGALATGIHVLTALALVALVGIAPQLANLIAACVAFAVSFNGHYWFTFERTESYGVALRRFLSSVMIGYVASVVCLWGLTQAGFFPAEVNVVLAALVIPAVNYVLGRLWVF